MFWSRPLAGSDGEIMHEGFLSRVGLDVHDPRLQAGRIGNRYPVLDLFLARGGNQDFHLLGIVRRRSQDLEVEVDFVKRKRDVLVRFGLDLELKFVFGLSGRDDDFLGNDHRSRQRHGDVAVAGAEPLVGSAQRFATWSRLAMLPSLTDVLGQRLDGIPLQAVGAFPVSESSTSLSADELISTPINGGDFVWKMDNAESSFSFSMGVAWNTRLHINYIKRCKQV